MKTERKKIEIKITEDSFYAEHEIDSLIELLENKKKQIGAELIYISADIDRYGDYNGLTISYYKTRWETDEEYSCRLKKEEEAEKRNQLEKERRKEELAYIEKRKIEEEQMKLLELMEKYPELVNKK